ncbi:MAG: GDP-mannose 4,6-dehydratase [Kiritimatiellae bacterium]|nr:GDP-mannose 4,6-dehydratase [Kiritimatiellia bacterium]
MRILITGAGGFVGRHVIRELLAHGHEPLAFDLDPSRTVPEAKGDYHGDLRDRACIDALVDELKPDGCLHLAGIAFVPRGEEAPDLTFSVNVTGTLHLLDAFRRKAPSARILVVSSATVYGPGSTGGPISETQLLDPRDIYSISKATADLTTLTYARQYGMHTMTARPLNHIGPGQSDEFVVASFARQIKAVAAGRHEPVISVGNLASERDFTDVRDVAVAYRLLLENGRAGHAYNIATGRLVKIQTVLDQLCRLAGVRVRTEADPAKHRPTTASPVLDTARIRAHTGWTPAVPLDGTLQDVLAAL